MLQPRRHALRRLTGAAGALALASLLSACIVVPARHAGPPVGYGEAVMVEPPGPQTEVMVAAPGPGYFWIGGYWGWLGGRYVWQNGYWSAHRPGYQWVPHHWERAGPGWRAAPGHWREAR